MTTSTRRLSMRDRQFWRNLTTSERAYLMFLQTSTSGGLGGGGYLPEDCGECGACGLAMLGTGMCSACYKEFERLMQKGRGEL